MKLPRVMIILLIGILLPGTSALPFQGVLYVISYPTGATIVINGTDSSVTDTFVHNVSAGPQNLTLIKAGYTSYTAAINVPAGDTKILLPISLSKGSNVINGKIQVAVDDATPGDTLYLANKVYRENVVINKSLTFIGGGPGVTIVDGDTDQDGEGNGRVFYIGPGTEVTLVGLTVENGTAPGDVGGGILNRGTLTVKNCDIHQNSEGTQHGGFLCATIAATTALMNKATCNGPVAASLPNNAIEVASRMIMKSNGISASTRDGSRTAFSFLVGSVVTDLLLFNSL